MFFKNNNKITKILSISILFIGIINFIIIPLSVNAFDAGEVLEQLVAEHPELMELVESDAFDTDIISLIQTIAPNLLPPEIQAILYLIRLIHPLSPSQQFMQDQAIQKFKAPTLDQYKWEVGIPNFVAKGGVVPLEEKGVSDLIKAIINWALKLAGVFAFVMIVWAGFEYTTSGGNTSKQKDAQTKIIGAIVGIILLFAFYIILYIINPDILKSSPGTAAPTPSAVTPPAVTPPAVTPPAVTPPAVTPPGQTPSGILKNIRYMGIPIDNNTFGTSEAYLDSALANKLDNLKGISPAWHVHDACINSVLPCLTTKNTRPVGDCHYYGTCVDIDSVSNSDSDNEKIRAAFNAAGLDVLDEGDHLHVALPGASGNGSYPGSDACIPDVGCWYGAG